MVEEMNKAVDETLSIAHYATWELHSYKDNSLYSIPKEIRAESFKELIEKAYKTLKGKEKRNNNERKT